MPFVALYVSPAYTKRGPASMMDSPVALTFPDTMPTLETDRLILRELTRADNAAILALFSDPRVTETTDIGTFERIEQANELLVSGPRVV